MKILITGASGFVGSQLVKHLSEHKLTILTRAPERTAAKLGAAHHYLSDLDCLANLDGFDVVINLAGEPIAGKRWSERQKQAICQSRWQITAKIATLIKVSRNPPSTFISASAVGFYGRQHEQHIDERFQLSKESQNEFTHKVCAQWEQAAQNAVSNATRVCIVRIGLVLGANGGALAKMLPAFKLGLGGPIANGKQGMSWIHQTDLIRLIEFMMSNEHCSGIYNGCAPTPISNQMFTDAMGKALKRPTFIPAPAFALKLALGEMSTLLIDGQYVVPQKALADGFEFRYTNIDDAFSEIFK
ncbi:Nucleoside-diphosphate sugar epimerase, putative [Shewanella piezotolerans WP3]|uniref:Nucleoside-diphosphate sugar epimerase, putative n=1 Tax=Shewanella piezotolerans (strain WP3 / JCM 13877) TaxID=225849 RepID=B8CLP9_SHEPW|nr:TIGR01777 family oxidoreductase [Shewanella piezotolerans]ACJ28700.1 Nucleoside-diphosphate sugar epimerase, putative [Shewanella piezotolerans WP3]